MNEPNELSDEQRAALAARLEARARSLREQAGERFSRLQEIAAPHEAAAGGDLADQADVELERDHENNALDRDVRELREIAAARARLFGEHAGLCVDCGEAIDFERLQACPAAARCAACQETHERESRRRALPALVKEIP